jgi:hypothetical protein
MKSEYNYIAFDFWFTTEYIRYYYQYSAKRLSTCPITIHALLHIADYIEATGPVWTSWVFPTERFCGRLLRISKSQRHPDISIARHVLEDARLTQIQLVHDMQELSLSKSKDGEVVGQFRPDSCQMPP